MQKRKNRMRFASHLNPLTPAGPPMAAREHVSRCTTMKKRIRQFNYIPLHSTHRALHAHIMLTCISRCSEMRELSEDVHNFDDFCIVHLWSHASRHKLSMSDPVYIRYMSTHTQLAHTMIDANQFVILLMHQIDSSNMSTLDKSPMDWLCS